MRKEINSILEGLSRVEEAKERTQYFTFALNDDNSELKMTDLNGNYTLLNKQELKELYTVLGQYVKLVK